MDDLKMTVSELVKKVKHQEEAIAQLIKIVAATNQRVTSMMSNETAKGKSTLIN